MDMAPLRLRELGQSPEQIRRDPQGRHSRLRYRQASVNALPIKHQGDSVGNLEAYQDAPRELYRTEIIRVLRCKRELAPRATQY